MKKLFSLFFLISGYLGYSQAIRFEADGLFGIMDETTQQIIFEPKYEDIYLCNNFDGYAVAKQKGKWGIIGKEKNLLEIEYEIKPTRHWDEVWVFNIDGGFSYLDSASLLVLTKNDKYGIVNAMGKQIVPFEYDFIVFPANAYDYYFMGTKDGKTGMVDLAGDVKIPFKYKSYSGMWNDDLIFETLDGKFEFVKKPVILNTFEAYDSLSVLWPVVRGEMMGAINKKGEVIIPFDYNRVRNNWDGFYEVERNNKRGLMNKEGKLLVPIEYSQIGTVTFKNIIVELNDKYGLYDIRGKQLLGAEYEYISLDNYSNLGTMRLNAKDALIDTTGKIVSKWYDEIVNYSDWPKPITNAGFHGLLSLDGKKEILKCEYASISNKFFKDKLVLVRNGGKEGIFDFNGKPILKIEFNVIQEYKSETKSFYVSNGNGFFWVNYKGQPIK